ncbi:hypothetical protein ACQYWQ_14085 [Streptomyces sp. P6-2-1]|uniref:hypothetical protein n=1 Tax=Streptomyces sp. P6-2-1 TaxID=3422591 RepID=UPI003D35A640
MEPDARLVNSEDGAWPTTSLDRQQRLSRNVFTACGFVDEEIADTTPGVVSSTFVHGGRIFAPRTNESATRQPARPRATLRQGDLAVVLVRRVGDSALVTPAHAGWPASRSIGIIRTEAHILEWLHIWLQTSTARARIEEDVTAHVEPTTSLEALRRMPFPLPPLDVISRYHRVFRLIEETASLYERTARTAVELVDALHEDEVVANPGWDSRPLAKVAHLKTGKGSERSLTLVPAETGVGAIAPRDLYQLSVPYVQRFRLHTSAGPGEVFPTGTFLLGTRAEGTHIAVANQPVRALRSVVALGPREEDDAWWLLHELRARSQEIVERAQGEKRREISALALKRLNITWPDRSSRAVFHRAAEPLHATAQLLVSKVATLHTLRDALLRDIAAKAGILREPKADAQQAPVAVPGPRGSGTGYEQG